MFLKRMLYASAAILMLAPAYHLGARSANASTIIYSTFDPGDTYDVTSGWAIGDTQVWVQALQFTPTESGMVQTIEIAAFRLAGGTAVNVSLTTDAGDQPGPVLETLRLCCFGGTPSIQLANSVLHPKLSAGTKYWLMVSPVAAGDYFGWNRILGPPYALNAQQHNGGPWRVGLEYRGTVRIRAVSVLEATVDLDPNVINLKSHARWLSAYIEPSGFDPAMIDISTVRLAGSVPADAKPAALGDHNANGLPDLMIKFSRDALDPLLALGVNQLKVTGSLATGETFEGTAQVRVIDPARSGTLSLHVVSPLGVTPVTLAVQDPTPGERRVAVYDARGRLVKSWREAPTQTGYASWDGLAGGVKVASGIYFIRVADAARTGTVKVIVAR